MVIVHVHDVDIVPFFVEQPDGNVVYIYGIHEYAIHEWDDMNGGKFYVDTTGDNEMICMNRGTLYLSSIFMRL